MHTPIQAKADLIAKYREKRSDGSQKSPVYAAMVESVDQSVGRVLDTLDQLDLAERTMVILFSDNGGLARPSATSNAPLRSGKGFPYEGGVREPLIVRWPGVVAPGSVCHEVVTSVDFYPTIVETVDSGRVEQDSTTLDGISIMPLLKQTGTLEREAVYWHYPHYNPIGGYPYGAVREGDWNLIEVYGDMHIELYNMKDDISETKDLAATKPDVAATLREKLNDWRISVDAQMPRPNPDFRPKTPAPR